MFVFPLVVAVIALIFGGTVLGQWSQRRRRQQLLWGLSLLMAAAAALAYVGFLNTGSELLFRVYYIFGALLNAAYLGMGSLYLVLSRRVGDLVLSVLAILSAIGVALILVAPVDLAKLHELQLHSGPGTGVIKPGLWLALFIPHNIFGAVTVAAVAFYSAYKVGQRQAPRRFALANITIALGVLVVSQAGSSARLGSPNLFWVTTAAGFVVIFAGFLLTTNLPTLVVGAPARDAATGIPEPASPPPTRR